MDLRPFTATPVNLEDTANLSNQSVAGSAPPSGQSSAFHSVNNVSTYGSRVMPPHSPAMSTTSTYLTYSNSQYGNSYSYNNSNNNNSNSNGNNAAAPASGGLLASRIQSQQRYYQNLAKNPQSSNTLSPSLSNNINPLNVNNWVDQQSKNTAVPPASSTPPASTATLSAVATPELTDKTKPATSASNLAKKDELDEEVIPTAIVIKNIPFSIKKEQLLDEMTKLSLPLPYAFNYHFDNGVFRGLAFANFTSTEETAMVVNNLNSKEIGGRKLRVEYKKMLPLVERERIEREKREKRGQLEEQHRSASTTSLASLISNGKLPNAPGLLGANPVNTPLANLNNPSSSQLNETEKRFFPSLYSPNNLPIPPLLVDLNNPEALDFYSTLLVFKLDSLRKYDEIAYPLTMSNHYKKYLNTLASFLGLSESYENGFIIIKRKAATMNTAGNAVAVVGAPNGLPLLHANMNTSNLAVNPTILSANQRFRGQPSNPTHQPQPTRVPSSQNYNLLNNSSVTNSPALSMAQNVTGGNNQQNNNISSAAILRGTRSYADVRNVPFGLSNIYNNNPNSSGTPNIASPTYLNISQPPTPGIEVNSRFGQNNSSNTNNGNNNNIKSPYIHNNNSSSFLNQSHNQQTPGLLGNSSGYFATASLRENNNTNTNNNGFNPPSQGIYNHYNNSNPNFLTHNHSVLNLTQNLTGGDTFSTTLSTNFNHFDDVTNGFNSIASPVGGSNATANSATNTPASSGVANVSFAGNNPNTPNNTGGLKSSAASVASNSPNLNNPSLSNSNSGKNLISSLNDGLGGLNLNVSNSGRRDIWGSGRPSLI